MLNWLNSIINILRNDVGLFPDIHTYNLKENKQTIIIMTSYGILLRSDQNVYKETCLLRKSEHVATHS